MIDTRQGGTNGNAGVVENAKDQAGNGSRVLESTSDPTPEIATRTKQRTKDQSRPNRFVLLAAGSLVVALLIFVAISVPRKNPAPKNKIAASAAAGSDASGNGTTPPDKSLFPITDSGRPVPKETHDGFLNEQDMQRTAKPHPGIANKPDDGHANVPNSLGSIPPFGDQNWQAPPYQSGGNANSTAETADVAKSERETMEKSSLVYVRSVSTAQGKLRSEAIVGNAEPEMSLGLPTGTRLRARLESAASTAVRTPVLAVIEYNYERNGEIIVPAGARVVGHMQDADRSGFVRIEFDSLMMPDGASIPIQAVATDLEMRPLRGKVEGKNTGKNVLVRSLSGIGEVGAMLVGRGNLSQPLSESDLLRERVSNNIGEAGDEQISRLAVTQHIVVTIPADIPIYVVLEKSTKSSASSSLSEPRALQSSPASVEELRQLLQLQRELNQQSAAGR